MILEALASRHELTIVALAWGADDRAALDDWRARGFDVRVVPHSRLRGLTNLRVNPTGPFQQTIALSPTLAGIVRALVAEAATAGRPYAALHVEHLRGAAALDLGRELGVRVVFDAVDCIAELARLTRAHSPNPLVRLVAATEERRTRALECCYVRAAAVTTVVAEREREALRAGGATGPIAVLPNGVPHVEREGALTREPVVIFTGKLSYHANAAAVRALLHTIWPQVRAIVPAARLLVAGAAPPRWLSKFAERDGVSIVADPPAILPLISGARVAVAPMAYGVGIQNKVLESMACGVPCVATPAAAAGFSDGAEGCLVLEQSPALFARRVAELLLDDREAERLGRAGQGYVRARHSWTWVAEQFETLYAGESVLSVLPSAAKMRVA
jgi:glycosyltransferase involved in cell wall biosynthesis